MTTDTAHPTTEQLKDPQWWNDNAPEWADRIVMDPEHGLAYYADDRYRLRVYDNGRDQPVFDTFNKVWKSHVKEKWVVLARRPTAVPKAPPPPEPDLPPCLAPEDYVADLMSQPYRPDPGTEALATWLEAPFSGRSPEVVLVKGYYEQQVWFTTNGQDIVVPLENVTFKQVDVKTFKELVELISVYMSADVTALADEILSKFDLTKKE